MDYNNYILSIKSEESLIKYCDKLDNVKEYLHILEIIKNTNKKKILDTKILDQCAKFNNDFLLSLIIDEKMIEKDDIEYNVIMMCIKYNSIKVLKILIEKDIITIDTFDHFTLNLCVEYNSLVLGYITNLFINKSKNLNNIIILIDFMIKIDLIESNDLFKIFDKYKLLTSDIKKICMIYIKYIIKYIKYIQYKKYIQLMDFILYIKNRYNDKFGKSFLSYCLFIDLTKYMYDKQIITYILSIFDIGYLRRYILGHYEDECIHTYNIYKKSLCCILLQNINYNYVIEYKMIEKFIKKKHIYCLLYCVKHNYIHKNDIQNIWKKIIKLNSGELIKNMIYGDLLNEKQISWIIVKKDISEIIEFRTIEQIISLFNLNGKYLKKYKKNIIDNNKNIKLKNKLLWLIDHYDLDILILDQKYNNIFNFIYKK